MFCCHVLAPFKSYLALRQKKIFTFSALVGPNITLFIDGKGTTCKDKYKYTNTKFVKDPMKYICENQDIKYKIPISLIPVF